MFTKKTLGISISLALGTVALPAQATVYTDTYSGNSDFSYAGDNITKVSTIKFDDWGYTGPNGTTAIDYTVNGTSGFDASQIGQVQHVVTLQADHLTPDLPDDINTDLLTYPIRTDANMDGSANFYEWGYTSPGYDRPTTDAQKEAYRNEDYSSSTNVGSRFNNMQIDLNGNYSVSKSDMNFGYYDTFSYLDTSDPAATPDDQTTNISFQPYATTDATGWCGSVMGSHPAALEAMAGQLKFDFAFDVSLFGTFSSTNIAPEFVMRSYGTLEVDVWAGGVRQTFSSDAVINNTNPDNTDRFDVDPDYQDLVSFHGAGVLPDGVWLSADSGVDANGDGTFQVGERIMRLMDDGTEVWDLTVVAEGTEGAIWHNNAFGGRAWILRADGVRLLDYVNPIYDISAVPVPAAVWLFGSGLLGLIGISRRKKSA